MRQEFFELLHFFMGEKNDIWALTGDLGFGGFDKIQRDYPDRFINCGAAEQAMMDMAVGLAMEGKIPFVYSITPFLLYRPFETLRTYVNHEKIPIILIGSGRDDDYKHDGWSHNASDDALFMQHFTSITPCYPETIEDMRFDVTMALQDREQATYINLKR